MLCDLRRRASLWWMRSSCRRVTIITMTSGVFCAGLCSWAGSADCKNAFTLKDAIEMAHVIDTTRLTIAALRGDPPVGGPIYSPDGKWLLLVTQRGVLSTNALEGTLWLFDRKAVRDYALGNSVTRPVPKRLATVSATSNTPIINDVR